MTNPNRSILDEIKDKTVQSVSDSDVFSMDLTQEIENLFNTGNITDSSKVIAVLKGNRSENTEA